MPMPLQAGLAVAIYDPSALGGTILQATLALARACWHDPKRGGRQQIVILLPDK